MSHHDKYDTMTLRVCNKPATLLTENTNGFFSFEIPGHLRDKDCYIHVLSGTVGNLDGIFEGTEDANVAIIRHNISTFSYDSTTKGTNKSFGTVIRPANNEKIGKLNEDNELDLGLCRLPPLLEVETIGFVSATGAEVRLDKASHLVEVILRLEFPNGCH